MSQQYLILLPPSEMKLPGGEKDKPYRQVKDSGAMNTFLSLESSREYLFARLSEALNGLSYKELEKVFGVKGQRLHEVVATMSDLFNMPTCPAALRYAGVMYDAIDYSSLSAEKRQRFDERVYMVDGLFGFLKATDYIPEYKLMIDSKFPSLDVSKYWKKELESVCDELFRDRVIIDILPEAHRKVLNYRSAKQVFTLQFAENKRGTVKASGHASKKLKGELVRYVLGHSVITQDVLERFSHSQGHAYSPQHSSICDHISTIVYLKD